MSEQEDFYRPELIDEQVDALLHARNMPDQDQRMADDLRIALTKADGGADVQSLQRVLRRLLESEHAADKQSDEVIPSLELIQRQKNRRVPIKMTQETATKTRNLVRVLSTLAAALIVAALVGSMLIIFHSARQNSGSGTGASNQNTTQSKPTANTAQVPQGIYSSSRNAVFKIDGQTHQAIWQQALPKVIKIVPAGSVIYVLQSDQSSKNPVNAATELNASDGKILWKHTFDMITTGLVLSKNHLYVSGQIVGEGNASGGPSQVTGHIYELNASNGDQVSIHFDMVVSTMEASDSVLAVGGDNTGLHVYDANTGRSLWSTSMKGTGPYNQVISLKIVNNLIYAVFSNNSESGSGQSYIAVFEATGGKQIWQSLTLTDAEFSPVAVDQNTIYFGTIDLQKMPFTGTVYAYNIQSNKQLWSTPVADGGAQEPLVVSNGMVYTAVDGGGTSNSHLIALDGATGTIKWKQTLDTVVLDGFCMSNGSLYVGDHRGFTSGVAPSMEVFNADGGQKLWNSAQYGSGNLVPTE